MIVIEVTDILNSKSGALSSHSQLLRNDAIFGVKTSMGGRRGGAAGI